MNLKFLKNWLPTILTGVFILLIAVFYNDLKEAVNLIAFKNYILSLGLLGPIIFTLLVCLTNIIPPFPVVPFWLVAIAVFNPLAAFLTIYISNIFGHLINFLIARHLGRPAVKKLAGQMGFIKIESYAKFSDFKTFLLIRLFGGGLADYISYGAGLTGLSFGKYLLACVLGLLPITIIGFVIMAYGISIQFLAALGSIGLFYLINYAISLLVPVIIYRHTKSASRDSDIVNRET